MKDLYFPRLSNAADQSGFLVLLPDSYDRSKTYIWWLSVHGITERNDGSEAVLRNLLYGSFKDGVRVPEWAFVNDDMKKAVDLYNIIIVVPNYYATEFFEPAKALYIYNFMLANFSVTGRFVYDGFSYGGGSTVKSASTLEVVKKMIVAMPAAPTANVVNWKNMVDAGVPIHFFVNDKDPNPPTNLSVTQKMVNDINLLNPAIKAKYTAFRSDYHGGFNEMKSLKPPISTSTVAGSVNNISENTWQWAIDVFNNGPRIMKTGTIVTPPIEPPTTTLIANAGADFETVTPTFKLKGSTGSTGYLVGQNAEWSVEGWPDGVNKYKPILDGAGYIDVTGKFETPGKYVFKLVVNDGKGNVSKPDTVTVTYNPSGVPIPTPRVPKTFDFSTKQLNFADGTKEPVTSIKIITESGTPYGF